MGYRSSSLLLCVLVVLFGNGSATARLSAPTFYEEVIHVSRGSDGGKVEVRMLRPAAGNIRHLVYLFYGHVYFNHGDLSGWLAKQERLYQDTAYIAAGVGTLDAVLLQEPASEELYHLLRDHILPEVELHLGVRIGPEQRMLLGYSAGSVLALDLALHQADTFAAVALQSPGWMRWDNNTRSITENYTFRAVERILRLCERQLPRVWMMFGDSEDDEWERRSRDNGKIIQSTLEACGVSVAQGSEVSGGHGFHLLEPSYGEALDFLFNYGLNDQEMAVNKDSKAVVRGYLEDVINHGNWQRADYFFAEQLMFNGEAIARETLARISEYFRQGFPDLQISVVEQIAEDNKVASRVVFRGSHQGEFEGIPPTYKQVEFSGFALDRLENGRVVEMWHEVDLFGLLKQLRE